jgi:hypothetical protein
MKISESRRKQILAIIGLVYGVIVVLTHQDYGINLDEPLHVIYGRSVVDWYLSGFPSRDIFSYTNLWLYGGLYDTISHLLTRLSPCDVFHTRHLLNAATGFGGVIGVYYLAQRLGSSSRAGLIAAVRLLLVPRYYGHAMFNHKDIPFAVGYVWSVFLNLKSMDAFPKVDWKTAVLTGIAIGATAGIRVAGAILGVYYLFAIVVFARPFAKEFDWWSAARSILVTGIVAYTLMIVCWPWVHANPITRPFRALTTISDFPFSITTLFEGSLYDSADVPWYYAPKWLLIGLPEYFLIGVLLAVGSLLRNPWATHHRKTEFVAFTALFPILYVVITDAPLYNGLRHILFVIPPLCVLSAVAVDKLLDRPGVFSRALPGLIAASALLTVVDTIRLHPNQYVYFNRLFGGGLASAASRYDTDYFANSHRMGAKWVDTQTKSRHPGTSIHLPVWEVTSEHLYVPR